MANVSALRGARSRRRTGRCVRAAAASAPPLLRRAAIRYTVSATAVPAAAGAARLTTEG